MLIRIKLNGPSARNLVEGVVRSGPDRSVILGLFAVSLLVGCASSGRLSVPLAAVALVEVPNRQLSVSSIQAADIGDQVLVSGSVHGPKLRKGGLLGHLHIEAKMADGGQPITVGTRWRKNAPRGASTGRFSARLPIADPSRIVAINVGYVADTHKGGR